MISVIIPNLHSPLIDQVIAAIEQQTARQLICEIIVVGQDRYGRVPPSARLVTTEQPLSAGAARNLGAKLAGGDFLLFLDADCIAAPDLVERLAAQIDWVPENRQLAEQAWLVGTMLLSDGATTAAATGTVHGAFDS